MIQFLSFEEILLSYMISEIDIYMTAFDRWCGAIYEIILPQNLSARWKFIVGIAQKYILPLNQMLKKYFAYQ